jgi:hypothetical protein
MTILRIMPLFALPVLGGVLLAFVIASFEDDDPLATEATSIDDTAIEPTDDTTVQDTVEPADDQAVTDASPPGNTADDGADVNVEGLFDANNFGDYWQSDYSPDISAILGNGTPPFDNQR